MIAWDVPGGIGGLQSQLKVNQACGCLCFANKT